MKGHAAIQLRSRLHPDDPLDVPVPGFPSHTELVAWARNQDEKVIRDEALLILAEPGFAQQYAAMGLLRALGVPVEGDGYGDAFRWIVELDGSSRVIRPPVEAP